MKREKETLRQRGGGEKGREMAEETKTNRQSGEPSLFS